MTSPTDVTGLIRRWRADSVSALNGAKVSSWPALTGGTALAQGTTAQQPTMVTSSINGCQALRNDYANNGRMTATITATAQPLTYVVVLKLRTNFEWQTFVHNGVEVQRSGSTWNMWCGTSDINGGAPSTAPVVLTAVANGTSSTLYVNGAQVATGPGTQGMTTALTVFNHGTVDRPVDAEIAEICIYNKALNAGERSTVHSYVQDRYAISVLDYSASGGGEGDAVPTPSGFKVLVDWDGGGAFADYIDDVTADVRRSDGQISVQYGREVGGEAPTTAGSGGFVVDNSARKFSSRNTASPLYGKIKPARPVKITRTVGGLTHTLFRGHTDETPLNPEYGSRSVSMSVVDYLADFRGQTVTTEMHQSVRTGEAIQLILDECGWTGGTAIDPGATVIPWWWEDGTDVLTALDKLVRSEGFPAFLTVGPAGEIVFRDRHHRFTSTPSTTSQSTWRSSGRILPVLATGFTYDDAWPNIVNDASVTVDVRYPQPLQTVWESDGAIEMVEGTSRIITASMSDPFINARVEYDLIGATTSFLTFAGTVTLTRTSGGETAIVIDAPSGMIGVNLSRKFSSIRVVAQPLTVISSVIASARDSGSVASYGARSFAGELPWCGVGDAQAILDQIVADRAAPLPVVEARLVVGRDKTNAAQLLSRDLSDRVTIVETETSLNDAFHIERIRHDFSGEADHEMTFTLEKVPPGGLTGLFQFGVTGAGFGQGKFGR